MTAMSPEATETRGNPDRTLLRWLLVWVRPYWRRVIAATFLVVAGSALQIVGPLLTAGAIDLYLKPRPEPAALRLQALLVRLGLPSEGGAGLATLTLLYLASLIVSAALLSVQAKTMLMTGQLVMRDLRQGLFAHLQRLDLAWFNRTPAGRVITRLTNDVEAVNELFTSGLVEILADVFLLGGIVAVLFSLDWRLALVAFSVLPFLVLLSMWFRANARSIYREVRTRLAAINTFLQEHLAGMSVVQLARAEARVQDRFTDVDAAHRDVNLRGIFYYAVFYPAVELLTSAGLAALLLFGGIWSASGTVSLGVLVAFLQYVQRFYRPISDLAENYNVLQASLAAAERLHSLLDTRPEVVEPAAPAPEPARSGSLAFEDVSFAYEKDQWALAGVSFAARPGERLAVVGHTGAGKSTLVNLLLRFYDPQTGRVTVDGVDVRAWAASPPAAALRRRPAGDRLLRRHRRRERPARPVRDRRRSHPVGARAGRRRRLRSPPPPWPRDRSSASAGAGYPSGSASSSRSPEPLSATRSSSSSTRRPPRSTRQPRRRSRRPSSACSKGGPPSSSPTGWRPSWAATGSSCSTTAGWSRRERTPSCSTRAACTAPSTSSNSSDRPISPRGLREAAGAPSTCSTAPPRSRMDLAARVLGPELFDGRLERPKGERGAARPALHHVPPERVDHLGIAHRFDLRESRVFNGLAEQRCGRLTDDAPLALEPDRLNALSLGARPEEERHHVATLRMPTRRDRVGSFQPPTMPRRTGVLEEEVDRLLSVHIAPTSGLAVDFCTSSWRRASEGFRIGIPTTLPHSVQEPS